MIKLSKLEKVFSSTGAGLGATTTDLGEGEWVTLLGPSGSGKTTLLRLIAGLEKKSAGTLEKSFATKEISYVFQEAALLPWKSVMENVILPLILRGVSSVEAKTRAEPWLKKLGLVSFANARPHELSGGLKMRVALARALVTEPKLLLMDEPFAALDEPIRMELGMELRKLFIELKPTIILVTHSITEGLWLADRAIILNGKPGQIIWDEKINLGAERNLALRGDPEFLKRVETCFDLLKNNFGKSASPKSGSNKAGHTS
jgi:NitT/TauT family transport system ATP-binding protein